MMVKRSSRNGWAIIHVLIFRNFILNMCIKVEFLILFDNLFVLQTGTVIYEGCAVSRPVNTGEIIVG